WPASTVVEVPASPPPSPPELASAPELASPLDASPPELSASLASSPELASSLVEEPLVEPELWSSPNDDEPVLLEPECDAPWPLEEPLVAVSSSEVEPLPQPPNESTTPATNAAWKNRVALIATPPEVSPTKRRRRGVRGASRRRRSLAPCSANDDRAVAADAL